MLFACDYHIINLLLPFLHDSFFFLVATAGVCSKEFLQSAGIDTPRTNQERQAGEGINPGSDDSSVDEDSDSLGTPLGERGDEDNSDDSEVGKFPAEEDLDNKDDTDEVSDHLNKARADIYLEKVIPHLYSPGSCSETRARRKGRRRRQQRQRQQQHEGLLLPRGSNPKVESWEHCFDLRDNSGEDRGTRRM